MTRINCAIYTRKSTEHGLEMEFNSLHNQEKCVNPISFHRRLMIGRSIKRIRTEALVAG